MVNWNQRKLALTAIEPSSFILVNSEKRQLLKTEVLGFSDWTLTSFLLLKDVGVVVGKINASRVGDVAVGVVVDVVFAVLLVLETPKMKGQGHKAQRKVKDAKLRATLMMTRYFKFSGDGIAYSFLLIKSMTNRSPKTFLNSLAICFCIFKEQWFSIDKMMG